MPALLKPEHLEPVLHSKRSQCKEKAVHRARLEKAHWAVKTQCSQNYKRKQTHKPRNSFKTLQ